MYVSYVIKHVSCLMLYNISRYITCGMLCCITCHVMLCMSYYVIKHLSCLMLYNMCHVMLYYLVMLCYITRVMLYNLCHAMLYSMSCVMYVI